MNPIDIPAWLDSFRPADELYEKAYEDTPAHLRALLKTAIAFAFHRYGMNDCHETWRIDCPRAGFCRKEDMRPAAWVLAVAEEGFASPARFTAAAIPAVLAGAAHILTASEAPFSPAVITAMELAGLEDSFVLNMGRIELLYDELRNASPDGRILFFPGGKEPHEDMMRLMHKAAAHGTRFYCDRAAPKILSLYRQEDTPSFAETAKQLLWLHPDADILHAPAPGIRAVFSPQPFASACAAPLTAGPGMEACWIGPEIEFFRTITLCAGLNQENPL